ncbi:hypothetical protein KUCAC02_034642 [Chaenocephalus aceratus]|nr:hypothetical protein KUCAC02_034642 [Chaenocephalus aceratus]
MKMPGGSPYSQYDMMVGDGLGDNWHRTPGNKMGQSPPPRPAGPLSFSRVFLERDRRVDPDSDPYMTPGSMMGNAVSPNLNDSEHQLLQDNTDSTPPPQHLAAFHLVPGPTVPQTQQSTQTNQKTSWPPEPIGHKPRQPKAAIAFPLVRRSSSPGGPRLGRPARVPLPRPGVTAAPVKALGAQQPHTIDGSTLRTICMQHGPLLTFHLGLTQGTALIRYGSKQEAAKAQSALHMCVLGKHHHLAEFVSEEDVARYIATFPGRRRRRRETPPTRQLRAHIFLLLGLWGPTVTEEGSCDRSGGEGGTARKWRRGFQLGWQSLDSTGSSSTSPPPSGPVWGSTPSGAAMGPGGGGWRVEAGRQGLWGGMSGPGYPSTSLWGTPALEDRHQMGSPASCCRGDLLGGGAD